MNEEPGLIYNEETKRRLVDALHRPDILDSFKFEKDTNDQRLVSFSEEVSKRLADSLLGAHIIPHVKWEASLSEDMILTLQPYVKYLNFVVEIER